VGIGTGSGRGVGGGPASALGYPGHFALGTALCVVGVGAAVVLFPRTRFPADPPAAA